MTRHKTTASLWRDRVASMGATLSIFFFGADQRLARGQEGRLRSPIKILYLVAVIAVLALVTDAVVGPSRGMALLGGWPAVSLADEPTPGTAPTPAAEAEQPSGEVQERAVPGAPLATTPGTSVQSVV